MLAPILLTLCGCCTLVPYIILRIRRRHVPAIILKVCTSVAFLLTDIAAALALGRESLYEYRFLLFGVIAGQIAGLLGDYWLDMKDMHTKHHDTYVFAGFTSFLCGHLFFCAGLILTYGIDLKTALISLAAGLAVIAGVVGTEKPMKLKFGKFKGITAGYSAVFGVVVALSLLCALKNLHTNGHGFRQALVMSIGLVVFLLSDLVLSGTFFGEGKTRPVDYTLNYLFYYGGQFTISLSLLALQ